MYYCSRIHDPAAGCWIDWIHKQTQSPRKLYKSTHDRSRASRDVMGGEAHFEESRRAVAPVDGIIERALRGG